MLMKKKTSRSSKALAMYAWAEQWDESPAPAAADWIGNTIRFSPDVEAGAGSYNLDERPYWRAILDAFDDPVVDSICVKKSTQVGGTVTLWAHMLYKALYRPAPCMVVLPDRESAIEFRDRIYLNALENSETEHLVPVKKFWNTRWIDLRNMRCYLAWSGSAQKLRMRACQTVYLSEVDVFQMTAGNRGGDPNKAAAERTKSFYSRKIYRESSPVAEPSTISQEYEESNQGRWLCPCPHCSRYQELRFFPYKTGELAGKGGCSGWLDDYGQLKDADDAGRDAHYICKNGCRIDAWEKDEMVRKGVYAAKGQSVDDAGQVSGTDELRRNFGLHLWSIHSPTITLGQIVREYVQQKRTGALGDFFGNWLGLEHASRRKIPTWQQLGKKFAVGYGRGQVWPKAYFLTTGVDVQLDRAKWLTVAWGDRCTGWVVDWGEEFREEELEDGTITNDLKKLYEKVITESWHTFESNPNPHGQTKMYARFIGIDSNHRTMDVHTFTKWCDDPRVRAIRGDHQVAPSEKYRRRIVERNTRTGEAYPGGLEQWGIYVNVFKGDLQDRFALRPDQAGAIFFPENMVETGKAVLQELVNEPATIEVDKNRRPRTVYRQKSGTIPVDWWDCLVYSRAMAEMIVDGLPGRPGWDAEAWPEAA